MNPLLLPLSLLALFISLPTMALNTAKLDNKLDGYREMTQEYLIEAKVIDENLNHPWALKWLNNNLLLVTERDGRLFSYDFGSDGSFVKTEVKGLPEVYAYGQGGLLDLELHPNYQINGWIYITYSAPNPKNVLESATTLARFRLINNNISNFEVLFQVQPYIQSTRHYGSRIVFDRQMRVYLSSGDRGVRAYSQDLENQIGKIIRLNSDGTVPADNPFLAANSTQEEINKNPSRYIYSYGHRNPQGLVQHKGKIYSHEHGPRGGDEFNLIEPGKNYGWPTISYGREYMTGLPVGESFKAGMEQPLIYWSPSIAPSGLIAYEGEPFSKWNGSFLLGSLIFGQIVRLTLNEEDQVVSQEKFFDGRFGRVRDLAINNQGLVYFITDAANGKLVQIRPVSTNN